MENIAIIGLGCRFPEAENPKAFWHLMRNGIDAITEIPVDRWQVDEFYDPHPATPGKMCTRWGGFLSQVDGFDPLFFNISPREAERMDPQQRLFLEVAWEALEDAGLATDKLAGTKTGVFVGMAVVNYDQLLYKNVADLTQISAYDGIGTTLSLASSRLSYLLDLKGPSLAIETACSSSLVAVHLACQSLRTQESNLCIVGGVNLILTPELNIVFSQAQMMSPDGHCKTFDKDANGYVRGEGCGVVILKRLRDAIEDRDRILAVIKGSAINQDGQSNGITAPNGPSQQAVIRQALENAGVKPADISYVEAHGTGTPLGDPIEVKSLKTVLMEDRPADKPCYIGSVKTNIGHLESAAGMAGLIKVVLSLQNREIPPHLHLKQLNPYIRLQNTPISIPTERQKWTIEGGTRLAGISSFGFGGTNAHVILEEATVVDTVTTEWERPAHLLTLSAKSDRSLQELAENYSSFLESHPAISLADICFTANIGRTHFERRFFAIAKSKTELQQSLQAFAQGEETTNVATNYLSIGKSPQIVFLFTGQGSQYVEMGRELYETQPTFRKALDKCANILSSYLDKPLLEIIYASKSPVNIDQTQYTQPALFALEYSLAQLWQSWGIQPKLMMGHSVGEYVAACLAGVFSLEDGLKLIAERGRLMQSLPQDGAMVSLVAESEQVIEAIKPYQKEVAIAAFNGAKSIVISGKKAAVFQVVQKLEDQGVKSKPLKVSHGFHSPLMKPMLAEFERVARQVKYSLPQINIISNVTGELATEEFATPEYWCNHILKPVQFEQGMATLAQQDCQILLEIGSKPILLGMSRHCLSNTNLDCEEYLFLPSLRPKISDWQQMLTSLGELYLQGIAINWQNFDGDYPQRQRVSLPTYPFQRQHYWIQNQQKQQPISLLKTDNTLLSWLDGEKIQQIKNQLETVGALSGEEIKLLSKLLQLIIKQYQQKDTAINNSDRVLAFSPSQANLQKHESPIKILLAASPKQRALILKQDLGNILSKVMKIQSSQLDWQQRLSNLGLDSLMATELRRQLEQQYQILIPVEFLAELNLEQFLIQLLCLIEKHHRSENQLIQSSSKLAKVTEISTKQKLKDQDNLWLVRPHPQPQADLRLFCFPYAGAGASIFASWVKQLPAEIELCAIQLPGRENLIRETPLNRLKDVVQTFVPLLKPYLDRPFAFFGHSMGALISFEVTRELRRQNYPLPFHLFVSGRKAPQLLDLEPPIHHLPDAQFIEKIKNFQGTPEVMWQDSQFLKQFLPILQADFTILETYFYGNEAPLNCPISVFGGIKDPKVKETDLGAWKQQTQAAFNLKMFPGDHFFIHSQKRELLQVLSTQLEQKLYLANYS